LIGDVAATSWEGRAPESWRQAWHVPSLEILTATTSTNDVAATFATNGAPAGTTVIADRQSRGRGREGRQWFGRPGHSLLMSVVMRPADSNDAADPSCSPLRVGLAVALAIEDVTGLDMRIKWPNDILAVDGRKLAGILCEGASGNDRDWLVAGIGINVTQSPDDFEPDIRDSATSIRMLGRTATREQLAGRIIDQLRPFRIQPPPLDPATLRELELRDALRGRPAVLNDDTQCTVDGIAPDGALRIRRDGRTAIIYSGTIRPAQPPAATDLDDHPGRQPTDGSRNPPQATR